MPCHIGARDLKMAAFGAIRKPFRDFSRQYPLMKSDLTLRTKHFARIEPPITGADIDSIYSEFLHVPPAGGRAKFKPGSIELHLVMKEELYLEIVNHIEKDTESSNGKKVYRLTYSLRHE